MLGRAKWEDKFFFEHFIPPLVATSFIDLDDIISFIPFHNYLEWFCDLSNPFGVESK